MARNVRAVTVAVLLVIVAAGPTAAQLEDPFTTEADVLVVTGVEYAFTGVPAEVPLGTRLGFSNAGTEVHELALYRIADDVTASVDELLAMYFAGQDPEAAGLVEMIGAWPLYAAPGGTAEGTFLLEREGRYAMICQIPQGLADVSLLEGLGPDTDPADVVMPEELLALIMANPPHVALGMVGGFTVTTPEGSRGPLPET